MCLLVDNNSADDQDNGCCELENHQCIAQNGAFAAAADRPFKYLYRLERRKVERRIYAGKRPNNNSCNAG